MVPPALSLQIFCVVDQTILLMQQAKTDVAWRQLRHSSEHDLWETKSLETPLLVLFYTLTHPLLALFQ